MGKTQAAYNLFKGHMPDQHCSRKTHYDKECDFFIVICKITTAYDDEREKYMFKAKQGINNIRVTIKRNMKLISFDQCLSL